MAQTRRRRHTKHRGNAAGVIEARGRTGRPPSRDERKRSDREARREERLNRRPTWRSSAQRGLLAGAFMFLFLLLVGPKSHNRVLGAVVFALVAVVLYIVGGFYLETFLWRRRMAKRQPPPDRRR